LILTEEREEKGEDQRRRSRSFRQSSTTSRTTVRVPAARDSDGQLRASLPSTYVKRKAMGVLLKLPCKRTSLLFHFAVSICFSAHAIDGLCC
jgi:hypothetical protein